MGDYFAQPSINENEWVIPDKRIIEQYVALWTQDTESDDDFKKRFNIDLGEIRLGEEALNSLADSLAKDTSNEHALVVFVVTLDSIYHTRLKDPVRVARKLHRLVKDEKLIVSIKEAEGHTVADLVDKISTIDKEDGGANIYSFATKFCSRFAPDRFPIFDSFAAGLLLHYCEGFTKTSLGSYKTYLQIYDEFISGVVLKGAKSSRRISYRHIDYFLWTYGKQLKYAIDRANKDKKDEAKNEGREVNKCELIASPYELGSGIQYVSLGKPNPSCK